MSGDFYETPWQNSIEYRPRFDTANAQANILFKYKDGGSTGVMGFQFLCANEKGRKRKWLSTKDIWKRVFIGGISWRYSLKKRKKQWEKLICRKKNWILYFVRVENEFSAERSLPETILQH